MKDAKGHGSSGRGGYNAATSAIAHQTGVVRAAPKTQEEYLQAGGKLPTEAQYSSLHEQNTAYIKGWGNPSTDAGRQAVARLQAELDQSNANYSKYGSEDKPTALTLKLRGGK